MEYKQQKNSIKKNNNISNLPNKQSSKHQKNIYYSFFTVILLLCIVQITISAVFNISKIISYKAKIIQVTKSRDSAQELNTQLKDSIKNFSNVSGLEAIARNNLKMSGEDEVLVIINTPEKKEKDNKIGLLNLKKHD